MVTRNQTLLQVYETSKSPHSYTGIQGLFETARKINPNITRNDVKSFLQKQESYTLHKIT